MEDNKLVKAESIGELLESCPINEVIGNNLVKAFAKINQHESAVCSISGGSDSDVMLDIVWRCDKDNKVTYVWFDTGLEYQATFRFQMCVVNMLKKTFLTNCYQVDSMI